MKLKIRYEQKYETLEVDSEEMWVTLSVEGGEELTQEEKEILIQDAFEEKFNRSDYNNWHKFDRHRGNLKKPFRKDDQDADESDGMDTVADNSQEEQLNRQCEYEEVCKKLREALKPEYSETIIAICLDCKTPEEYAAEIGEKRDAVYKRLQRAKKKYQEIL